MDGVEGATAATTAAPSAPAQAPAHAPPPSPKRTQGSAFSVMMSPAKKARGLDGGAMSTQSITDPLPACIGAPPTTGTLSGSAGALFEFCRKVLKLTAFRLALMCDNFDFSPLDRAEVSAKVYETIEHALYHQTHLFYNRHIDQIMLSALYGYCKVHKLQQVSFREIIAQYRKQPQSQQPIFRSVVIEQSNPGLQIATRADIIAFYNQVFVPAMKAFLLKGESGGQGADSKPVAAGNSGNNGAAVGAASVATGATSGPGSGLPPLPPRSASHSPRGQPKLPPLSSAGPRMQSAREAGRPSGRVEGGRDGVAHVADSIASGVKHEGKGHSSPVKSADGHHSPAGPAATSRHAVAMGATASPTGSPQPKSRSRGAAAAAPPPADHKIPDGLAALLQALDSQQQDSDGEDEDRDDPPPLAGRSSRRAASVGRDRSRGRGHAADDAMDAEGPGAGEADHPSVPAPSVVSGRRQRTPNRRYGSD